MSSAVYISELLDSEISQGCGAGDFRLIWNCVQACNLLWISSSNQGKHIKIFAISFMQQIHPLVTII